MSAAAAADDAGAGSGGSGTAGAAATAGSAGAAGAAETAGSVAMGTAGAAAGSGGAGGDTDPIWGFKLSELTTEAQARVICDRVAAQANALDWSAARAGFCAREGLASGAAACQTSLSGCMSSLPALPTCNLERLQQCPELNVSEYLACRSDSSVGFVAHYDTITCSSDVRALSDLNMPSTCSSGKPSAYDRCPALMPFEWTTPAEPPGSWVDAWSRSAQSTTVTRSTTEVQATSPPQFGNQTLRLMLWTTVGGSQVRVKLTNAFSTQPLAVGAVHVALRQSGGAIVPASDRPLSFGGQSALSIAAGAEAWSDPVALTVPARADLAVSVYLPGTFTPQTFHPTAQKTSYLSRTGNFTAAVSLPAPIFEAQTTMIFFAAEVQVRTDSAAAALVALGDSITDGYCSDLDANGAWPDLLSKRLTNLPDGTPVGIINAGVSSNRFTASDGVGQRGLDRLPELLRRPGVRWVMLLEGINDISYEHVSASELITAYQRAIALAHAAHVKILGSPLLPIGQSTKDTPDNQLTRAAVNTWIRTSGAFDAVVDFEPALVDPTDPSKMRANLTCDYVHPNQAGYQAMADAIDLSLFR